MVGYARFCTFVTKVNDMKNILGIIVVVSLILVACNKDKFQTKPQLFIKSINKTSFVIGDNIKIQLEFTDAEGDVQDTLWVQRTSRICPASIGVSFTVPTKIPNFESTKNQKGIFEINYRYGRIDDNMPILNGCSNRNDTSFFKFWMKDKAGNRSDTVTTTSISLLR